MATLPDGREVLSCGHRNPPPLGGHHTRSAVRRCAFCDRDPRSLYHAERYAMRRARRLLLDSRAGGQP